MDRGSYCRLRPYPVDLLGVFRRRSPASVRKPCKIPGNEPSLRVPEFNVNNELGAAVLLLIDNKQQGPAQFMLFRDFF